jgi:hypothetical protein
MAENVDILLSASSIAELLEHLQCPQCKNRMTAPITFCDNGHNVCSQCRESLEECPTCSHQFSGIRNTNLEKISSWSNFTCPYLDFGCPVMRPVALMADHIAICTYKRATCPLDKIMSIVCPWEGLIKDIAFHCKESHRSRVVEREFFVSSSTEDAVNVLLHDNEIFIFHKRFLAGKFYCAVEKVGITHRPYSATFILDTLSGFDKITFTHTVNVMSKNLNDLIPSAKFLKLNDKLLKRFISDGKLALQVMISKANLKN